MSSVNSSVIVQLTKGERELLEAAIIKIKDISDDVNNSESTIFADSESVFYCLRHSFIDHDNRLPTIVDIYE